MKLFKLLPACCIIFCLACQKTEPASPEPTQAVTEYHSFFHVRQYFDVSNNGIQNAGRIPSVTLYKWVGKAPQLVKIDSVYFNSLNLKITPDPYYTMYYTDTVPQNTFPPFQWKVIGSGELLSFVETVQDSFPVFTKFGTMPDSIKKSNTTVLQLGARNATAVRFYIDNGTSPAPYLLTGIYFLGGATGSDTSATLLTPIT